MEAVFPPSCCLSVLIVLACFAEDNKNNVVSAQNQENWTVAAPGVLLCCHSFSRHTLSGNFPELYHYIYIYIYYKSAKKKLENFFERTLLIGDAFRTPTKFGEKKKNSHGLEIVAKTTACDFVWEQIWMRSTVEFIGKTSAIFQKKHESRVICP